jgi:hypothetical protein
LDDIDKLEIVLQKIDDFDLDICKIYYYKENIYVHKANFVEYNNVYEIQRKNISIYRNLIVSYFLADQPVLFHKNIKRFAKYFFKGNYLIIDENLFCQLIDHLIKYATLSKKI